MSSLDVDEGHGKPRGDNLRRGFWRQVRVSRVHSAEVLAWVLQRSNHSGVAHLGNCLLQRNVPGEETRRSLIYAGRPKLCERCRVLLRWTDGLVTFAKRWQ